ncbi:unnamed protein product, partial [Mesorhabditis spiculigera]
MRSWWLLTLFLASVSADQLNNRIDPNVTTIQHCPDVQRRSGGVNLVCCNSASPPFDGFSPVGLCQTEHCQCHLQLFDVHCDRGECNMLSLNSFKLPFVVTVEKWTRTTRAALEALCDLDVVALSFYDLPLDDTPLNSLAPCFSRLQNLEFSLSRERPVELHRAWQLLASVQHLRIVNVDFEWGNVPPAFLSTLKTLHVENSTMAALPKGIVQNRVLARVTIKGTELDSLAAISQLSVLTSAHLASNQLADLHNVVFVSAQLRDLDLTQNQISALSAHTLSKCVDLRVLDISGNPLTALPARAFANNRRLKYLKLSHTFIQTLQPGALTGLPSLRSLALDHTPLHTIHPLALVSLKNLKSLNLESANLTKIPSAITSLCHLTHVNLGFNLLHSASSLPPEVLVHLSSLSDLRLDGNPIQEFPPGVLLLSTSNTRLLRQIVHTFTSLPVWSSDRCTPYYFNMHLRNSSSALRHLVSQWSEVRMKAQGLGMCRERYEWMRSGDDVYEELERSSGCSVSRGMRGALPPMPTECPATQIEIQSEPAIHPPSPPSCDQLEANVLIISLAINALLLVGCIVFGSLCCATGRRKEYQQY